VANVILINPFEVPADAGEQFVTKWSEAAEYMRRQDGFVATRLHRALAPDARFGFVNVADWESPRHFQAAVQNPEFAALAKDAPPSSPSLYEVVRTIEGGSS